MTNLPYRIVTEWSAEDDAFIARVPTLPGCIAHGHTLEEVLENISDAATTIIEVMTEDGLAIPPPDVH